MQSTIRAIGASSSGLRSSFAVRTVGDWNQLPAVVVEQESPAAFKNQLSHVACRNAPPPAIGVTVHEEVCQLLVKTSCSIQLSSCYTVLHRKNGLTDKTSTEPGLRQDKTRCVAQNLPCNFVRVRRQLYGTMGCEL